MRQNAGRKLFPELALKRKKPRLLASALFVNPWVASYFAIGVEVVWSALASSGLETTGNDRKFITRDFSDLIHTPLSRAAGRRIPESSAPPKKRYLLSVLWDATWDFFYVPYDPHRAVAGTWNA